MVQCQKVSLPSEGYDCNHKTQWLHGLFSILLTWLQIPGFAKIFHQVTTRRTNHGTLFEIICHHATMPRAKRGFRPQQTLAKNLQCLCICRQVRWEFKKAVTFSEHKFRRFITQFLKKNYKVKTRKIIKNTYLVHICI